MSQTKLEEISAILPILVVDDDPAVREMLEMVLVDEGYPVVLAGNGREALESISRQRPGLILLDLMMPIMDGWQFLEALQLVPGAGSLPVLLLSASREIALTARQKGVKAFLPKPFELDKLLGYVATYSTHAS